MLALPYRCGAIVKQPFGKSGSLLIPIPHSGLYTILKFSFLFFDPPNSPQLEYIDNLDAGMTNTGVYVISPANYRNRDNNATRDMQFGFIQINLTNPEHFSGLRISP